MKAMIVEQFGSADVLKYRENLEIPTITDKQVLIRVKTTCVNFADIKARNGGKSQGLPPFIPGLEAAGVIERVGAGVQSFRPGQRVLAFPLQGSYAEYIAAEENLTFALPDAVDWDTAGACGIVSFLAYKLLADLARMEHGDAILVHSAAGGVGTTAIQIAKALGAGTVIGTVGNESKARHALSAGADHVICYETEDWAGKIMELTQHKGVPVILDSIGGHVTAQSLSCLSPYGRLVVFGNSSGSYAQLQTGPLHTGCRSVLGFSLGTTRKERPELLKTPAEQVFRMLENGLLKLHISQRFPLREAAAAQRLVESRLSVGKVLLDVENG